jgi:DNA-directed RNA polymerase specialized sigma24 family protein
MGSAKAKPQDAPAASADDIRKAFESLTDVEQARLDRYARWRMRALGSRQLGLDGDEFVSDALLSLLQGNRKWRPANVSFYVCFKEILRSQSSNLRAKRADDPLDEPRAPWVKTGDSGVESDPLEKIPSAAQDPERALEWEQTAEVIKTRFRDDEEAALVLESRLDGRTPVEIRDALALSQSEYETVMRRVKRALEKIVNGGRQ